jgi:hypothetical protein
VKVAKAKGRARIAVLECDGAVEVSRDYMNPDPGAVEVP